MEAFSSQQIRTRNFNYAFFGSVRVLDIQTLVSINHARQLRRKLSLPEGLLWQQLRARPGGFKFRRQHPIGPYILDFFCHGAGLAVEVDGLSHEMGGNPARDERRDEWVARQGVMTLRIAAADVLAEMETVVRQVVHLCRERTP